MVWYILRAGMFGVKDGLGSLSYIITDFAALIMVPLPPFFLRRCTDEVENGAGDDVTRRG